mgnify:CR=1 FL=1
MEISATELKQHTGQTLDTAQREPVRIMKHGRLYGAVISGQDLEVLEKAKKSQNLKDAVQAGFTQLDDGQTSTRSMDELLQEAVRLVEAKKHRA